MPDNGKGSVIKRFGNWNPFPLLISMERRAMDMDMDMDFHSAKLAGLCMPSPIKNNLCWDH